MNISLFKEICSTYATGVTIITSKNNKKDYGFTANSFTSVSIDPLLVLFCLNKEAKSNIALKKNSFFNVSILSNDQKDICFQFANNKLTQKERFSGVETTDSKNNIKIISNSCSFLECRITDLISAGDHFIYVGECLNGGINKSELNPLIYHKGKTL
jgi:flavin reductase (DIM6/NTAB) family NADH-FMN oxidoreductase RutF|tara:strand:+ start:1396 stop:1866 length:471 start_codon:yes stop_codon:yes gene_type:complete